MEPRSKKALFGEVSEDAELQAEFEFQFIELNPGRT